MYINNCNITDHRATAIFINNKYKINNNIEDWSKVKYKINFKHLNMLIWYRENWNNYRKNSDINKSFDKLNSKII